MNWVQEQAYYRAEALEALREDTKKGLEHGTYSINSIRKLKDMADRNIYPDGRFGDLDCNLWSLLGE